MMDFDRLIFMDCIKFLQRRSLAKTVVIFMNVIHEKWSFQSNILVVPQFFSTIFYAFLMCASTLSNIIPSILLLVCPSEKGWQWSYCILKNKSTSWIFEILLNFCRNNGRLLCFPLCCRSPPKIPRAYCS